MFSFKAEGFSCSLDALYGGTWMRKLRLLIQINIKKILSTKFFLSPIFGLQNPVCALVEMVD
jgi:hypothetical protein